MDLVAEVVGKLHTHAALCTFMQDIYRRPTKFENTCCEWKRVFVTQEWLPLILFSFLWGKTSDPQCAVLSLETSALPTISPYLPCHIHDRNKAMFVHPDPHTLGIQVWYGRSEVSLYHRAFVWAIIWYLRNRVFIKCIFICSSTNYLWYLLILQLSRSWRRNTRVASSILGLQNCPTFFLNAAFML